MKGSQDGLAIVAARVARLIHCRCLVVYLFERDRRVLRARRAFGPGVAALIGHEVRLGDRLSGRVAQRRTPLAAPAPGRAADLRGGRSDLDGIEAGAAFARLENAIAAPLFDGGQLLGVLALYDGAERPYGEGDLRALTAAARQIGGEARSLPGRDRTDRGAHADPLTRLPDARLLFVSFQEEIARATRLHGPLSLIELDIDRFSEINARHGRAAGDRILRGVARAIRGQMRRCDSCVRYAADEFIVTLPGVGKDGIEGVTARIARAIAARRFVVAGGRSLTVTVRMGSATFPEDGRSLEDLIAVADTRMFGRRLPGRLLVPDGEEYQRFSGRRDVPVN